MFFPQTHLVPFGFPSSLFTSRSQAKQFQACFQPLANITEYFGKVRSLANILATACTPLPALEFVTYLLIGLGPSYDSFVTSVTTRVESISSNELYQLLLVHEIRLALSAHSSVTSDPSINYKNASGRGWGQPRGGRSGLNGRGINRGGRSFSPALPTTTSYQQCPTCQVCNKAGHVALQCQFCFDHCYQYGAPPSFFANFTCSNNFMDSTWYPNSAVTHHITHISTTSISPLSCTVVMIKSE